MLGMHPEIQEQAYEEAIQILGRDGSIEYQDLSNLNYIECCLYEVLRLFPIGPIVARKVDDNIEIGMFKILPFIYVGIIIHIIYLNFLNVLPAMFKIL